MVIVEHRLDDVWPLADRLLVLGRNGRPLAEGRPTEVIAAQAERMGSEGIWLPRWAEPPGTGLQAVSPSSAAAGRADGPSGHTPAVLEVSGLAFAYPGGAPVLERLDLRVRSGEAVAIVGANGSGKSTLARLLVGLATPARGSIEIGGVAPARTPPARRTSLAGLVFQDPELGFLATTVEEDVRLGLPRGQETDGLVGRLMAELGLPLEAYGQRSPYRLSGGEQRRLSLVPALLRGPKLLVLDEPTFAQDRTGVVRLLDLLRARAAEGVAVIAVSHDERFVAAFADRVLELRDGRLHDRGVR